MIMEQIKQGNVRFNTTWAMDPEELVGKTIGFIAKSPAALMFVLEDGEMYSIEHSQICCEEVWLEDVCGDLEDLLYAPLLGFEIVTNQTDSPAREVEQYDGTYTWTFVKMWTAYGSVTLRWYGESNGFYSEEVELCKLEPVVKTFKWNPREEERRYREYPIYHPNAPINDLSRYVVEVDDEGVDRD